MNKKETKLSRKIASFATAALLAVSSVLAGFSIANAGPSGTLSYGEGYGTGGTFLGAFHVEGQDLYCVEAGRTTAPTVDSGSLVGAGTTLTSHNNTTGNNYAETITATEAQRINYIITKWSNTHDRRITAAVQLAVWSLANSTLWGTTFYGSTGNAQSALSWYSYRVVLAAGSAERNIVLDNYNFMLNDAAANAGGTGGATSGSASLSINMVNGLEGNVTVTTSPTNATGTLHITGATINSNGGTSIAVTNGSVVAITGIPIDGNNKYEITANASFSATVSGGPYPANITIHSNGSYQKVVSKGNPPTTTINFSASEIIEDPEIEFHPVVTTEAPEFVEAGEQFTDTLYANIANPTDPTSTEWIVGVPINATGTLYGPFAERPVQSSTVPIDAPIVVDDVSVRMTGPGTYTTPDLSELIASESGYYTWVWSIEYDEQSAGAQLYLPVDYSFTDDFGQVIETSVVPMQITFTTDTIQKTINPFGQNSDVVSIFNNDEWLIDNGSNIPVVVTGTAYFYPGTEAPVQSPTIPAEATVLGNVSIVANDVGDYTSTSVTAPNQEGYIVWVWSIESANQTTGYENYVREWADEFGVPSEITQVVFPTVVTSATPESALTDVSTDTAIVNGLIPDNSSVTFNAYKAVIVGEPHVDSDGNVVVDTDGNEVLWTQEEIDAIEPDDLCTYQPVYDGSAEPVEVTAGENVDAVYPSSPVVFNTVGTYYWVETLWAVNPDTLANEALHVGECGLPNETTVVSVADMTSQAVSSITVGGSAYDTAIVNGLVPEGATVYFELFRQIKDGDAKYDENGDAVVDADSNPVLWTQEEIDALADGEEICSASQRIFDTSETPIDLTPGFNDNAEYQSESTVINEPGEYYWVETFLDKDGNVLHRGGCAVAEETTIVTAIPPVLPRTGADDGNVSSGLIWTMGISFGTALLTAAALVLIRRRRMV